jgi:hypothetical protein
MIPKNQAFQFSFQNIPFRIQGKISAYEYELTMQLKISLHSSAGVLRDDAEIRNGLLKVLRVHMSEVVTSAQNSKGVIKREFSIF